MLKKIRKMLQRQEGFTLVELMIVVVILGIISGIGIQQYGKVQDRARRTAHNANVRIIENAVRMYEMLEDDALDSIQDLVDEGYLENVPDNPMGGQGYTLSGDPLKVNPGMVDVNTGEPISGNSTENR